MPRRTCRSLLLPGTVLASLLVSPAAHAESAPARPQVCAVQLRPQGAAVPANLPALVVDDEGTSSGLTATIEITKISGGTPTVTFGKIDDPKTAKTTLLVQPSNDLLEVGTTYTIDYATKCSNSSPDRAATFSFVVGPAVALPTRIGEAKAQYADGSVVITPSTELAAFLRTTRFEVFVDGESLGTTRYGSVDTTTELDIRISRYGVSVSNANPSGSRDVCKTSQPEKHEVRLAAHVAGADADPEPMTLSVDVDCSKPVAAPGNLPDGGNEGMLPDEGSGVDQGCSVGGAGPLGNLATVFLAGAGIAVLFRRRRR